MEMLLYLPLINSSLSTYDYMIIKRLAQNLYCIITCVSKTLLFKIRKLVLNIKFITFFW